MKRISVAVVIACLAGCYTMGGGSMGGGASYHELMKEKADGKAAEYAMPPAQLEILARENFAAAGWRTEMRKQECDASSCMSLRGNEGTNDGRGSAVLWFEPGAAPGSTRLTIVSSTAMSFSANTSGVHPMEPAPLHARVAAAVRSYQEKKAAGM